MRRFCALLMLAGGLALAGQPPVGPVGRVYVLPMGSGLDQYLANHLTRHGYEVVTDPKLADTWITDRLGESFEQRVYELAPPPPPPPKEKGAKEEDGQLFVPFHAGVRPVSTFSRGRGNVYFVSVQERNVLWSTYLRPENTRPDTMDDVAAGIVKRLNSGRKSFEKVQRRAAAKPKPQLAPQAAPPPASAPAASGTAQPKAQ